MIRSSENGSIEGELLLRARQAQDLPRPHQQLLQQGRSRPVTQHHDLVAADHLAHLGAKVGDERRDIVGALAALGSMLTAASASDFGKWS